MSVLVSQETESKIAAVTTDIVAQIVKDAPSLNAEQITILALGILLVINKHNLFVGHV
jgi:hypothetical protein